MYLHFPGLSTFIDPFVASILTCVMCFMDHPPIGEPPVMGPNDVALEHRGIRTLLPKSPAPPAQDSLASKRSHADPSHEDLISYFSALRDKRRPERNGSCSRYLKNLTGEHSTLQERYVASVRRTEAVRTELEVV
ncbi:hypothetical protein LIER_26211 [Lithospermum erythrorhizon]|uniref:Uncharacterized protein n=1 Tax=Lithospermum erythrorhizon TaxID=34254 RepID=A0AAV3R7K5_LITER